MTPRAGKNWPNAPKPTARKSSNATNDDLLSPKAQQLAGRFKALVDEFTMGDPKILEGLRVMHAQGARGSLQEPYTDVKDFLGRALLAGGNRLAGG